MSVNNMPTAWLAVKLRPQILHGQWWKIWSPKAILHKQSDEVF